MKRSKLVYRRSWVLISEDTLAITTEDFLPCLLYTGKSSDCASIRSRPLPSKPFVVKNSPFHKKELSL
jgi:hypothetical protein